MEFILLILYSVYLELNGVTSAEEDLVEASKLVDSTAIKLMCYFQDDNGVYYYLDNIGRYVYEDII